MDLYEAIHEMRRLSKLKIPFSFTFMSCNLTSGKSDGIVEVKKGRILKRQSEKYHQHADIIEKYIDLTTMQARQFYQPLLMTFNGQQVTLQ